MKVTINEELNVSYPLKAPELLNYKLYYDERGKICLRSGCHIFFLGDGVTSSGIYDCEFQFRVAPGGTTVTLTQ